MKRLVIQCKGGWGGREGALERPFHKVDVHYVPAGKELFLIECQTINIPHHHRGPPFDPTSGGSTLGIFIHFCRFSLSVYS